MVLNDPLFIQNKAMADLVLLYTNTDQCSTVYITNIQGLLSHTYIHTYYRVQMKPSPKSNHFYINHSQLTTPA